MVGATPTSATDTALQRCFTRPRVVPDVTSASTLRTLGAAGFLSLGVAGAVVSAFTFGAGGALYVLLFGVFALAGVAMRAEHAGYTAATLLAGAALSTVLGVGRVAVLGELDVLSVAFLGMGVTTGWRGYQYYEARE